MGWAFGQRERGADWCVAVRLRKFRSVGKSGMWCGATLRYCGVGFPGPWRVLQSRGRTWLQLMCCTSVLELGVLISEWSSGAAEWRSGVWQTECDKRKVWRSGKQSGRKGIKSGGWIWDGMTRWPGGGVTEWRGVECDRVRSVTEWKQGIVLE